MPGEKRPGAQSLPASDSTGVLCHDGETHLERLSPQRDKTFTHLEEELHPKTADPEAFSEAHDPGGLRGPAG